MTELARGLDATLSIVSAAGKVFDHPATVGMANRFGTGLNKLKNTTSSIAAYSAQTNILSRMFIEESIIDEIVIPHFSKASHEWYAAQIISSLGMSRMVDGHRTIQDVMSLVQTGHTMREKSLVGLVARRAAGLESFSQAYTGESAHDAIGIEAFTGEDDLTLVTKSQLGKLEDERDEAVLRAQEYKIKGMDQAKQFDEEHKKIVAQHAIGTSSVSVKPVETSKHKVGPMGELYEVTLSSGAPNSPSVSVPVFIQMQPSMIPTDLAPRFIDMNVNPTLWQRWTQMKAGEITFWKDFVFQADLARRHQSILKDPRQAKAFSGFLKTIANKDKYALADITDRSNRRQSSNLANSVIVFSESTVAQAKVDSGIDLHNEKDRERYFRQTYTMMIAVVDPVHQRVTVYFHGVDGDLNLSYNDFRPRDKNFEPKDFMAALQAFSTNNIGRLR